MSYRIEGVDPHRFEHLFGLADEELERHNARRVIADSKPGFPCRVILNDAEPGETLLLVNYVSLDIGTPFRTAYAIDLREAAVEPALYVDELPPVFHRRTLSLRGFDGCAGRGRGKDWRAIRPEGSRDHSCAQCGLRLLCREDRKELRWRALRANLRSLDHRA